MDSSSFGIEYYPGCAYDFLEIFDGDNERSPVLGGRKFCGSPSNPDQFPGGFPSQMRSSTNEVIIKFKSDASIQGIGFRITWSAVAVTLPESPSIHTYIREQSLFTTGIGELQVQN